MPITRSAAIKAEAKDEVKSEVKVEVNTATKNEPDAPVAGPSQPPPPQADMKEGKVKDKKPAPAEDNEADEKSYEELINEFVQTRTASFEVPPKVFAKIVKGMTEEITGKDDYVWSEPALSALQAEVEWELVDFFDKVQKLATHANRKTISLADIRQLRARRATATYGEYMIAARRE